MRNIKKIIGMLGCAALFGSCSAMDQRIPQPLLVDSYEKAIGLARFVKEKGEDPAVHGEITKQIAALPPYEKLYVLNVTQNSIPEEFRSVVGFIFTCIDQLLDNFYKGHTAFELAKALWLSQTVNYEGKVLRDKFDGGTLSQIFRLLAVPSSKASEAANFAKRIETAIKACGLDPSIL